MNSHPYARAIPSPFFSTTQAVIHANRRNPDDTIMTIPYSEARAKVSQKNLAPQRSTSVLLIVSRNDITNDLKSPSDSISIHSDIKLPRDHQERLSWKNLALHSPWAAKRTLRGYRHMVAVRL